MLKTFMGRKPCINMVMVMVLVYHSTTSVISPGSFYQGSDREKLSILLGGGEVGFAYIDPPPSWTKSPRCWVLELPEDTPVALSLNGETIPRRDMIGLSFEDAMSGVPIWSMGEKIIHEVFLGTARELSQFKGREGLGELAFRAKGVRFINRLTDIYNHSQ